MECAGCVAVIVAEFETVGHSSTSFHARCVNFYEYVIRKDMPPSLLDRTMGYISDIFADIQEMENATRKYFVIFPETLFTNDREDAQSYFH